MGQLRFPRTGFIVELRRPLSEKLCEDLEGFLLQDGLKRSGLLWIWTRTKPESAMAIFYKAFSREQTPTMSGGKGLTVAEACTMPVSGHQATQPIQTLLTSKQENSHTTEPNPGCL